MVLVLTMQDMKIVDHLSPSFLRECEWHWRNVVIKWSGVVVVVGCGDIVEYGAKN